VAGTVVAVSGLVGFVAWSSHTACGCSLAAPTTGRCCRWPRSAAHVFCSPRDTIARTAVQPTELRVGVDTAVIGAPFFLWALSRTRRDLRDG
jgi:iron complex transport system permease protein